MTAFPWARRGQSWALVWTGVLVLSPSGSALADRVLDTPRVADGSVTIDGVLDEAVWADAPVGSGFVERVPRAGAVPPVDTEVRVLHDANAVYVAVTMRRPPGEEPRALELTRDDTRIWDDDAVTLKFDVQKDRRTTVGFAVNAAGAQLDFAALDNGDSLRLEFDAAWESATRVTDDAWIAEVRLPFVALGLSPGERGRLVGFDVSRDHAARRATYDWVLLPPEFSAFSAQHYGTLRGLEAMSTGVPLTVVPFALLSVEELDGDFDATPRFGGDVRMRFSRDLWSELTVLTDFADTEVDDRVANLNRFRLFQPEKRTFFLTGLDAFDFGHPASSEAQLFFSRRIGLDEDDDVVPLLVGLKQYGHVGPVTVGLLDVLTDHTGDTPVANWSVARLSTRVSPGLELGAMGTLRADVRGLGAPDDVEPRPLDGAGGVDGALLLAGGRLGASGMVAGSSRASSSALDEDGDPIEGKSGAAARLGVAWLGEDLQPELSARFVSDDFDPPIGFVERNGVASLFLDLPWYYRAPTPWIDEIKLGTAVYFDASDELDQLLGRGILPGIEMTLRSGWQAGVGAEIFEDLVEEDFTLIPEQQDDPEVVVPAGRYQDANVYADLSSPANKSPSFSLHYEWGRRFDTPYHGVEGEVAWAPSRHLRVSANGELRIGDPPYARKFTAAIANAHLTLAMSTDLFADVIVGGDNLDQVGVLYVRVRWRYRPGSDVFLVYREDVGFAGPNTHERMLTLKVSLRLDAML